jgi:hypothetical protein
MERAEAVGGRLVVSAGPDDRGTVAEMHVPVEDAPPDRRTAGRRADRVAPPADGRYPRALAERNMQT